MTDDLETALRAVGTRLDVPPTPQVTDAVLARLDSPVARRPVGRLVAAAVAVLIAFLTAVVVSPTVRAAVYDLLRVGGVEIHENEKAPPPVSVEPVLPGERDVSLAEAREAAPFPLRLPAHLGDPDNVRLINGNPPRVVSMAFGAVRIDQFDGGLAPMFSKFAGADDIRQVTVDGGPGVWVDRPHVVIYNDRDGTQHEETARLAGSTLIWEKNGITYRVEGALTQPEAIAIADSLR